MTAFSVLSDVGNGYPLLLTGMTILTALRTAVISTVAAKHLARKNSRTMVILGTGAKSEFQELAVKAILDINTLRLIRYRPVRQQKYARNLAG